MTGRGPRRRSLSLLLSLALVAAPGTAFGASAPGASPPGASAAAAAAAGRFTYDLSVPRDFVAQTNFVQCVGASMQMMLNMIRPKDDRSAATQLTLQELARDLSGQRPDGRERQGASVRGWTAGMNLLGAGPYRLVGTNTLDDALRVAATAMRETGHPVGLLVWRGRHAWVMSGFHATADPLTGGDFDVTAAVVMDPLYPYGSKVWGPSPKPREALTPAELGKQFVRRGNWGSRPSTPAPTAAAPGDPAAANNGVSTTWAGLSGKYVLVLPFVPIPVAGLGFAAR